jgi:hypothetical protein
MVRGAFLRSWLAVAFVTCGACDNRVALDVPLTPPQGGEAAMAQRSVAGTDGGQAGSVGGCLASGQALARIQAAMVGTWDGVQSNPWTGNYQGGQSQFQVQLAFRADGTYSGHCADASCPSAVFYYGSDDDSSAKRYQLLNMNDDGTARGELTLLDWPGGDLDAVAVSPDLQRLTFEFWDDGYGPVIFDLTRAPSQGGDGAAGQGSAGGTDGGQAGGAGACLAPGQALARIQAAVVGTWDGVQTNPWSYETGRSEVHVELAFRADGTYSGHCAEASCPMPVFYWGTDDDSPGKRYQLIGMNDNGTARGGMTLLYGWGLGPEDDLDAVAVSSDSQHLTFEFWSTDAHGRLGPIAFDLTRVP